MAINNKNDESTHQYWGNQFSDAYYEALSHFLYEMDVQGQRFFDQLMEGYIRYVDSREKTLSSVQLNTGMTHGTIKKSLKRGLGDNKQFSTKSFFQEMVNAVKKICLRNESRCMKIKGGPNSFSKLFYKNQPPSKAHTSKSFLEFMIKRGIIEKVDDKTIRFVSSVPSYHINTKEKMINLFQVGSERLSHTLIRNFKAESPEDRNFQRSYRSKHIDPSKHPEARDHLNKMMKKFMGEVEQYIDSLEAKTEFEKNRIENTGSEFGVSMFSYNYNPEE